MKKSDRIKKNEEIAKIVSFRKRVISDFFIIYYQPASTSLRTAISVSKELENSINYLLHKINYNLYKQKQNKQGD